MSSCQIFSPVQALETYGILASQSSLLDISSPSVTVRAKKVDKTDTNHGERHRRKPGNEEHDDVVAKTVSLRATVEGLHFLMIVAAENKQLGIRIVNHTSLYTTSEPH